MQKLEESQDIQVGYPLRWNSYVADRAAQIAQMRGIENGYMCVCLSDWNKNLAVRR